LNYQSNGQLLIINHAGKKEVLSVFPNTMRKLATTRSWDFLGMPEKLRRNVKIESHIIVGLLDTGDFPFSFFLFKLFFTLPLKK